MVEWSSRRSGGGWREKADFMVLVSVADAATSKRLHSTLISLSLLSLYLPTAESLLAWLLLLLIWTLNNATLLWVVLVLAAVVPQKTKEWESESRRDFKITHSTCSPNPILFPLLFFMISRSRIKSSRPLEKNEMICFLFYFYYYYDYYYKRRKWGGFDFQKWYDENNACFPLDWCMALTLYYVHFNLFFSNK